MEVDKQPDSPSKIARTAKEPLVDKCLELQQALVDMANKLQKVENNNKAALEKKILLEQVVEDLIFKVGAVKQVGTSPITKLQNKKSSPRNSTKNF